MKKKKEHNFMLIISVILLIFFLIPWGNIHKAVFDTARSKDDVIRISSRELSTRKDAEMNIIAEFEYDGAFEGEYARKKAFWVSYDGEKIALVDFKADGEKLVFDKRDKPMNRGNGCYSEVLFNGYAFMSTNEKLATFVINGERINVNKLPFVYYHKDSISGENTVTTEYYFLDKDGNEL